MIGEYEVTREEALRILMSLTPAEGDLLHDRLGQFLDDDEDIAAAIRKSITCIHQAREANQLQKTQPDARLPTLDDVPDIVQVEDEFELCRMLKNGPGLSIALEMDERGRIAPIVFLYDSESGAMAEVHIEKLETVATYYSGEAREKILAILSAYRAKGDGKVGAA